MCHGGLPRTGVPFWDPTACCEPIFAQPSTKAKNPLTGYLVPGSNMTRFVCDVLVAFVSMKQIAIGVPNPEFLPTQVSPRPF